MGQVLGCLWTLLAVCLGFVMFRAGSAGEGFRVLAAMFGGGASVTAASTLVLRRLLSPETLLLLGLGSLLCTPLPRRVPPILTEGRLRWISYLGAAALLALCLTALSAGSFTPFIYFHF